MWNMKYLEKYWLLVKLVILIKFYVPKYINIQVSRNIHQISRLHSKHFSIKLGRSWLIVNVLGIFDNIMIMREYDIKNKMYNAAKTFVFMIQAFWTYLHDGCRRLPVFYIPFFFLLVFRSFLHGCPSVWRNRSRDTH